MFCMKSLVLAASFAVALTASAHAQVPNAQPPYNTPSAAVMPSAARAAGSTYTGATQTNIDKLGVVCQFKQTASSGSPSLTFGIQIYDAATATWLQQGVSGAVTTATNSAFIQRAGVQTSSLPSDTTAFGLPVPNTWRPFITVGGSGSMTGLMGCGYVK